MAELVDLAEAVVGRARRGEQLEVVAVRSRNTEVRAHQGEVESYTSAESAGVGVRVVVGGRQGFASAGTLDPAAVDEALAEARDNAEFASVDPHAGVAEPDGVAEAELDLFAPELARITPDERIRLALELEKRVLAGDARITGLESAEYADSVSESAVVTSTGIRATSRETSCWVAAYSLAEHDGDTQTGFGFSVGRRPDELDVERAAVDAVERAVRLLGATKPRSERLTVVLDPFVTAQLLDVLGEALDGESVLKGRSLFAQRVGEEVAHPSVTLVDDPTDPASLGATANDGEGLATRRTPLIVDGVLQGFVHNSYTARALGTRSTGSAVRSYASTPGVGCQALSLRPGPLAPAEVLAAVGEGILVQGVSGIHSGVNPVSGDVSTGAEGLRIRGGELAEPLREFTIASTLQRMLADVAHVGADLEWFPGGATGLTLALSEVTVSGS